MGQHAVAAREAIARGSLRGATLAALLQAVPTRDRDAWVDAVLGIAEMPDDDPSLPRGAVPYLPCGVAEILAVVELVPLGPSSVLGLFNMASAGFRTFSGVTVGLDGSYAPVHTSLALSAAAFAIVAGVLFLRAT